MGVTAEVASSGLGGEGFGWGDCNLRSVGSMVPSPYVDYGLVIEWGLVHL